MPPSAYTSARSSTSSPAACSGDMNPGVPSTLPARVTSSDPTRPAAPSVGPATAVSACAASRGGAPAGASTIVSAVATSARSRGAIGGPTERDAICASASGALDSCLARPQSMTTVSPNLPTSTLPGLRSRWMTRWACA
jgi:hypothetical protein